MSSEYRPVIAPLEKAKSAQSLICLLQGLEGMVTTVELRNNNIVKGKIEHVDAYMCIIMKNVTFCTPDGREMKFTDFFVHGTNVRYVQIPDHVNIMKTIEFKGSREKRALHQLQKEHDARVKAQEKKMRLKAKEIEKRNRKELLERQAKCEGSQKQS